MTRPAALREAVANLYNVQYRQNKKSKYTYENVCIVPGGRAGLSRCGAVVGDVYCVRDLVSMAQLPTSLIVLFLAVVSGARLHGVRSDARRVQASCAHPDCVSASIIIHSVYAP